jgi:pimeloyl-ACP methyl ester carboxylesterase
VGGSTGTVPLTVQGMADAARVRFRARPHRHGTGGRCRDRPPSGATYIYADVVRAALARTDVKEFLFFPRTPAGKATAKDYVARIRERVTDRDDPITLTAFRRQITGIKAWGRQQPQNLTAITAPALIATGDQDRMAPTARSRDTHARLPDSTIHLAGIRPRRRLPPPMDTSSPRSWHTSILDPHPHTRTTSTFAQRVRRPAKYFSGSTANWRCDSQVPSGLGWRQQKGPV